MGNNATRHAEIPFTRIHGAVVLQDGIAHGFLIKSLAIASQSCTSPTTSKFTVLPKSAATPISLARAACEKAKIRMILFHGLSISQVYPHIVRSAHTQRKITGVLKQATRITGSLTSPIN